MDLSGVGPRLYLVPSVVVRPRFKWSFAAVKDLLLKTVARWSGDAVPRLAAAFSFYAILSLAPLLVLAVTVAGTFMVHAEHRLLSQAAGFVGQQGSDFLGQLLAKSHNKSASIIATLSSLAVTFFGASNLFLQLDDAMSAIWGLRPTGPFLRNLIVTRIFAFLGVLIFGTVTVGWLVLDSWLNWMARQIPGLQIWPLISFVVSIVLLAVGFAVSFKSLPRDQLQWSDVWPGAIVTAIGFAVSKFLLGEYFAIAGISAAYGAAGALVVILLWIYYTSQIYFFGAELTCTYAHEYGSAYKAEPEEQFS